MNEQLNTFELSRKWFNYGFDNPEKIKPLHTAIYFFAIEHCNRLGWKQKFGFPSQMVMEALGIKNWRTYSKGLNDLVEFGFIEMIEVSKNQYSSNIIAIVKNTKAPTKALDKALQSHSTKHSQGTVSITKQYNKEQENNITEEINFDKFLDWFNERRTKYIDKPSNIKRLTHEEKTTLNLLKTSYNNEDFEFAMYNLCNDKWANENSQVLCSYFLQIKTFNKFLSTEKVTMLSKDQRRRQGWKV